ncbi:hypothetical protein JCM19053_1301 [Vibrio sp. JCM 19053]|nr:hypothetical protein JCM19053_1301 [Vibrio sp. JCM 19053]
MEYVKTSLRLNGTTLLMSLEGGVVSVICWTYSINRSIGVKRCFLLFTLMLLV